jgi:hypothetical protein
MGATAGMSDLLALATIRRMLLELGVALGPEEPGTLVGPLELWMHQRRPEWEGRSPLQVMADTDGSARVLACLVELTSGMGAGTRAGTSIRQGAAAGVTTSQGEG